MAFTEEITDKWLARKLETHNVATVAELFALAAKCAHEGEGQIRVKRRNAPAKKATSPQKT